MRKFDPENERLKQEYQDYLRHAEGLDHTCRWVGRSESSLRPRCRRLLIQNAAPRLNVCFRKAGRSN